MVRIRLIGDIHYSSEEWHTRRREKYLKLISDAEYTVQLGDFGFHYDFLEAVNAERHLIIPGNHEQYDQLTEHFLGDFGTRSFPLTNGEWTFFWIRGGFSIDFRTRIMGLNWFPWKEELSSSEANEALAAYRAARPSIMLSHECPANIIPYFKPYGDIPPSRTARLLEACFEAHRPQLWVFAHHHRNWKQTIDGTTFICLDGETSDFEAGYLDFDEFGKMSGPFR